MRYYIYENGMKVPFISPYPPLSYRFARALLTGQARQVPGEQRVEMAVVIRRYEVDEKDRQVFNLVSEQVEWR